jgi:hypothetical protein
VSAEVSPKPSITEGSILIPLIGTRRRYAGEAYAVPKSSIETLIPFAELIPDAVAGDVAAAMLEL